MTADHRNTSIPGRRVGSTAQRRVTCTLLVIVLGIWLAATPTAAFDTGPHFDMTEDVLASREFAFYGKSIRTVQSANFLVDFHEFMRKDMFKSIKKEYRGIPLIDIPVLDPTCRAKMEKILEIGDEQMHFDDLGSTADVARRWDAMVAATEVVAKQKAKDGDILGLLTLLGMSLHNVQDFYTHSNWVEQGFDNPGIGKGALAAYGTHPTWLSVDRAVREKLRVYTNAPKGSPGRWHGGWDSNWKTSPPPAATDSLNKDWAGRNYYPDAYLCAYFATAQWTRLFRYFLRDTPAVWWKMVTFDLGKDFDPSRDWEYARQISFYGGHWNGNGGPTGFDALTSETAATSPFKLIESVLGYMRGLCLTSQPSDLLRKEVEHLLLTWATMPPPRDPVPLPYLPKPDSPQVTFAKLEVFRIDAIDTGDRSGASVTKYIPKGLALANELDWYARIRLGGQSYWSCLIDEHNDFDFKRPYAPWTMIKALPSRPEDEELTSLCVKLRTGTGKDSGTDDAVFLWLGGKIRELDIPTEKADLESGSEKTFCIDLVGEKVNNERLPLPYYMSDIRGIRIRKSKDSDDLGQWQIGGIEVWVNGIRIYEKSDVNVYLDTTTPSWTAPNFTLPGSKTSSDVPVVLRLMELDDEPSDPDDHSDIHPSTGARDLGFLYSPASEQVRGGGADAVTRVSGTGPFTVEGRGDKDRARLRVGVTKIVGTSK